MTVRMTADEQHDEYSWQCVTDDGAIAASCAGGFASADACREAFEAFRDAARNASIEGDAPCFDVEQAAHGNWRWSFEDESQRIVAASEQTFGERSAAHEAADRFSDAIGDATIEGQPSAPSQ